MPALVLNIFIMMGTHEEIKNETTKIYESILASVSYATKHYHLMSLYNFMINFDELRHVYEKRQVHDLFKAYLIFLQNNIVEDINSSHSVFTNYIQPIGKIYQNGAGFKFISGTATTVFIIVVVNLLLLICKAHPILFIPINMFGILKISRDSKIRKTNKFFSFNY